MTEENIVFLYKAATAFSQNETNESYRILKSHYLMRCKDITRGYGLPKKHFSEKTRCSFCCLEWNNKAITKLKPVKLSKQQRRRIRARSKKNNENLLYCKELEKTCSFCRRSIKIPLQKPDKPHINITNEDKGPIEPNLKPTKKVISKPNSQIQSDVYYKSNAAFSLKLKKNTLISTVKQEPKKINNAKKKKDKFSGLCQKAVMAAAMLKEKKNKENKLNLFLKPSL